MADVDSPAHAGDQPSERQWPTFRDWPRPLRLMTYMVLAMALLLVVVAVAVVNVVRRPLPHVDGTLTLPGLTAPVEVIRDDHGIAHVYADTTEDLMRAQGFVHAQDRFWEMDVRRHVTAGRLAELFGKDALQADKVVRTLGWRRVAEQELALVAPRTRAALQAYADGVNAYLDQRSPSRLAIGYTLLDLSGENYHPEPWTPVDSLAWLKAMAWDLRGNMQEEIARTLAAVNHDADQVAQLYPAYPYADHLPIVRSGAVVRGKFAAIAKPPVAAARPPLLPSGREVAGQVRALAAAQASLDQIPALVGRGEGIGSNSWVVGGAHTATGKPLLANDPHLGVSQPGVWYQVGLHCRTVSTACPFDVSGFSFSGVPGVVIGHNARIAWGFTNLGPDVSDLFLEKVLAEDWLHGGRYQPLAIRTETIHVRGGADFELTIRETGHGPLISDVSSEISSVGANIVVPDGPPRGNGYAVALAWTALTPQPTADALLGMNAATDWDSFRAAARDFAVPAQNLVYADVDGNIGYQAPGRIPIRKPGNDGTRPVPGWLASSDWTGSYVPYDALPNVLNPAEGFIATANQAVIGPSYQYHLTSDWDYGYRAQRIRDLLTGRDGLTVDDLGAMQLDTHNDLAATLVPYLLRIQLPAGYASDGKRLLATWDYRNDADSAAAAYFAAVWDNLLRLTFHDELRRSLWPDGSNRWWAVVTDLLGSPTDSWWDSRLSEEVVEGRDDILRRAMLDARNELTRRQSLDADEWSWGRLHQMNLHDPTLGRSGIGLIERLVNRNGYRVGGGGSILNATQWNAAEGYAVAAAPSMRMVVSLADLDASRWINLTGVSGHPASDHYADQTRLYVEGRTLPWPFSRSAVEATEEDTLTLVP